MQPLHRPSEEPETLNFIFPPLRLRPTPRATSRLVLDGTARVECSRLPSVTTASLHGCWSQGRRCLAKPACPSQFPEEPTRGWVPRVPVFSPLSCDHRPQAAGTARTGRLAGTSNAKGATTPRLRGPSKHFSRADEGTDKPEKECSRRIQGGRGHTGGASSPLFPEVDRESPRLHQENRWAASSSPETETVAPHPPASTCASSP